MDRFDEQAQRIYREWLFHSSTLGDALQKLIAAALREQRQRIEKLEEALADCIPLAIAWMGYYASNPAYGGNGVTHPMHQEVIDNARAALEGK